MANNKFTNVPTVKYDDPEYELLPPSSTAPEGTQSPNPEIPPFAPGATETLVQPPENPQAPHAGPEVTPPNPALGMNPQGQWTADKVARVFPGMFQDTTQWLDPAEEAKKREGLPYDATKKYDEKKLYPGINAPSIPGAGGPDTRPPISRMDRSGFERKVLGMLPVNPFTTNPYDEVLKADAKLPQLFNSYFNGHMVWEDRGRMTKEESDAWNTVKKQFHERNYKEADAKQKQALLQYKTMMGNFDIEQRQANADLARQDKLQANKDKAANKTPDFREIFNADGVKTLHTWDNDTKDWMDTGKRTGQYTLDDMMPPRVRYAQSRIDRLEPKLTANDVMALGLMPEAKRAEYMNVLRPPLDEAQKKELAYWKGQVTPWQDEMSKKFGNPNAAPGPTPASAEAAKVSTHTIKGMMGALLQAKDNADPRLDERVEKFKGLFPDYADELDRKMSASESGGVRQPSNVASTAGETPTSVNPTPAPVSGGKPAQELADMAAQRAPGDNSGLVQTLQNLAAQGNHLAWNAAKGSWKALDDVGKWMIQSAKDANIDLGRMVRGQEPRNAATDGSDSVRPLLP